MRLLCLELKNFRCRFFFRDDGCDGKTTLGVTAELHYEQNVDVYVGMPCSAGICNYSVFHCISYFGSINYTYLYCKCLFCKFSNKKPICR